MKTYYYLTKPGIIYGNDLSAVAGFMLGAHRFGFRFSWLLATLVGMSLVIAAACVFNNYIDRDIDRYMTRTKKRALVTKQISVQSALSYGVVLGLTGFAILAVFTNLLTVIVGLVGFADYVALYGLSKRHSVHGTLIGSVAGAMPIVAGYTAVSNRFDGAAWLLFLAMISWQMPHFYAIAIRRLDEYKAAGLPVLPVKKGSKAAKTQIVFYVIVFMITSLLLSFFGYTGIFYAIVAAAVGLYWLYTSVQGFNVTNNTLWARKMFLLSLVVLLIFCVTLSLNFWLA